MKFIAIAAFATSALAAAMPQRFQQFCDGNGEGCYAAQCTCDRYDYQQGRFVQDDNLGAAACNELRHSYPNIYFQVGRGCVDANNRGIEPDGFNRACQDVSFGQYTQPNCLY